MGVTATALSITACLAVAACSGVSSPGGQASTSSSAPSSGPFTAQPSAGTAGAPVTTASPTGTPTATALPTAGTTRPATGVKADLQKLVLRAGDLPASWRASPPRASTTSDAQSNAALAKCAGGRDTSADELAKVESDDFTLQNSTISSSASREKSQADVEADTALLRRPAVAACFRTVALAGLRASLPAGAKIGTVDVKVHPGANGGPTNLADILTSAVQITAQGRRVSVYVDAAFLTGPRTEAEIDFEGLGARVSTQMQARLIKIVAARVARG